MLPRPIATLIAVLLTLAECLNMIGQVFLGSGDSAFHVAYVGALGALGLAAKVTGGTTGDPPADEPDLGPEEPPPALDADTVPRLDAVGSRHRRSRS